MTGWLTRWGVFGRPDRPKDHSSVEGVDRERVRVADAELRIVTAERELARLDERVTRLEREYGRYRETDRGMES